MSLIRALLVLLLCLGASTRALSQTSSVSGPPMVVTPDIARVLYESMAASLRKLVVAQEDYFSDHNVYGRTLSDRSKQQVYIEPAPGVTLTLTYVTKNSWAGRATHAWLPGRSCVIVAGEVPPSRIPRTTGGGLVPQEEGRPVCDEP